MEKKTDPVRTLFDSSSSPSYLPPLLEREVPTARAFGVLAFAGAFGLALCAARGVLAFLGDLGLLWGRS